MSSWPTPTPLEPSLSDVLSHGIPLVICALGGVDDALTSGSGIVRHGHGAAQAARHGHRGMGGTRATGTVRIVVTTRLMLASAREPPAIRGRAVHRCRDPA
jgi:hypothetical protein